MGAHQKIDRVARRNLRRMLPNQATFPSIQDILHFEGRNGPDGIKAKSPGVDEPWHYIDPAKPGDTQLYTLVQAHSNNLAQALKTRNESRAAFEAAWLAHAIVDGLTPAHHYPLSDKIEELWGKPHHERTTIREKNIIRGATTRDSVSKNWQYWGAKGVFTTHFMFEFGFASTISGLRFNDLSPSAHDIERVKQEGIVPVFRDAVHEVFELEMYHNYHKHGWNRKMATQSREILAPIIINAVTLAWYEAAKKAGIA